jgi:hypothetical protein
MLPPVILVLAALYAVLAVVIIRRLRKPTCRVCLLRQFCPNRESEHSKLTNKPCWSCGETHNCTTPAPDAKS